MATLFVVYIPTGNGDSDEDSSSPDNHKNNESIEKPPTADSSESTKLGTIEETSAIYNEAEPENTPDSVANSSENVSTQNSSTNEETKESEEQQNDEKTSSLEFVGDVSKSEGSSVDLPIQVNSSENNTKRGSKPKNELTLDITKAATSPDDDPSQGLGDTDPLLGDGEESGKSNVALARDRSGNSLGKNSVTFEMGGAEEHQEMITEHISVEQLLQAILAALGIERDVWMKTDDDEHFQVSFLVENKQTDLVLQYLTRHGIGTMDSTSVSLFPSDYHMLGQDRSAESESGDKMSAFMESVKSKLTVAQVVDAVKANAILTFDYVVLIVLASVIAAMGLAENSSVVLVASMLVSPLMGPIMGGTFGVSVRNRDLIRLGLKNETIGLTLCIVIGFLVGLLMSAVNHNGANWGATDAWPTSEMQARGLLRSLWVGVLIAIPSGAGVALSILGGNTGSLVGVAISASLLPPAVNAGMLWAYAIVSAIDHPEFIKDALVSTTQNPFPYNETGNMTSLDDVTEPVTHAQSPPDCPQLVNNKYEFVYRCDMAKEAAILGSVSLFLTLLNIICIIVMGILILKLKEVAPKTALSTYLDNFWKTDIKVARDTYKTMKASDSAATDLAKLAKQIATQDKDENGYDEDAIFASLENDPKYWTVVGKLPNTPALPISQMAMQCDPSKTVHSWSHMRGSPTSPTSPRVVNPFANPYTGLRHRLNKAKSEDLPSVQQRPVKVIRQDSNPHHHRARRSYYRQDSAPAHFDHFTVDPSHMVQSTSKGRFMITTVPGKEDPNSGSVNQAEVTNQVSTNPRVGRVTFRCDSLGQTPV